MRNQARPRLQLLPFFARSASQAKVWRVVLRVGHGCYTVWCGVLLVTQAAPGMAAQYRVPPMFAEDLFSVLGPERPHFRWLVAGPPRSVLRIQLLLLRVLVFVCMYVY